MPTKPKYIVTDASIYTARPTVTEHQIRVIEEVELSDGEKAFAKIIAWILIFLLIAFIVRFF
jgi:hypothetical protein